MPILWKHPAPWKSQVSREPHSSLYRVTVKSTFFVDCTWVHQLRGIWERSIS